MKEWIKNLIQLCVYSIKITKEGEKVAILMVRHSRVLNICRESVPLELLILDIE